MENTADKTIITVVGKDTVGIIAKVCTYLSKMASMYLIFHRQSFPDISI